MLPRMCCAKQWASLYLLLPFIAGMDIAAVPSQEAEAESDPCKDRVQLGFLGSATCLTQRLRILTVPGGKRTQVQPSGSCILRALPSRGQRGCDRKQHAVSSSESWLWKAKDRAWGHRPARQERAGQMGKETSREKWRIHSSSVSAMGLRAVVGSQGRGHQCVLFIFSRPFFSQTASLRASVTMSS